VPTFNTQPSRPRQAPGTSYGSPSPGVPDRLAGGSAQPVPWTLGQTILGTLLTLVPLLALLIGSQLLGSGTLKPLSAAADTAAAIATLVVTVVIEGALLIAPLLTAVIRRAPGYSALDGLRALGFRGVSVGLLFGWLVGGVVIALAANVAYSYLVQKFNLPLQTNGDLLMKEAKDAPRTVLATLLGAALIAPICEETFFRGFLEGGLLRYFSGGIAVFFSALLFGIAHGDVGSFALLFVLGLVLGIARATSGSLWPGFVIHTANNTLAGLAVLPIILPALQH
jgi:membrane protease YdiL (CAAX protease family)